MKTLDNKICTRQLFIIYFIAICSPIIRVLPIQLPFYADGTVWITPIINLITYIILVFTLQSIFKKHNDKSLSEIIELVFGNIIGKIILIIYAVYCTILASLYVRYLGERLLTSIYVYAPLQFFTATILILAFFVIKSSIENLGRFSEIFLYIFLGIIILITLFSFQNLDLNNFTVPNVDGFINNVKCIPIVTGVFGYITFALFLGDHITHKDNIKRYGIKIGILLAVFCLIVLLITIGSFGYNLSQNLSLPFFSAIKNIEIFNTIERIESVFITLWIITDFIIITMFLFIVCNIIKYLTKAKDIKYISTPIIFIVYCFTFLIARNAFELQKYSSKVSPVFNFTLTFIFPIVLLIIGKIRKKI